jgi:hypothetical protein
MLARARSIIARCIHAGKKKEHLESNMGQGCQMTLTFSPQNLFEVVTLKPKVVGWTDWVCNECTNIPSDNPEYALLPGRARRVLFCPLSRQIETGRVAKFDVLANVFLPLHQSAANPQIQPETFTFGR